MARGTYDGQEHIEAMRKALTELEFELMPDGADHKVNHTAAFAACDTLRAHTHKLVTAVGNAS